MLMPGPPFFEGKHFAFWFPVTELRVFAVWGSPTVQDAAVALEAIWFETTLPIHRAILDVRRLGAVPPETFASFEHFMQEKKGQIGRNVERGALVHAGGIGGAAAAGYSSIIGELFPRELFASLECAVTALGFPASLATKIDKKLVEIEQGTSKADSIELFKVREWLRRNYANVTVETCAKAIGTSDRSLQRTLQEAGTSLRDEIAGTRLVRAQQLLVMTSDKLLAIAQAVGFAKPHSLIALFERHTQMSPDEWRKRHRGT